MRRREPDEIVETLSAGSYGGTVLKGGLHTALGQVVLVGCQVGSVVILSRLLDPADFGLVAMIGPVVVFMSMVKEMGLLQAVVQSSDLTYRQLNSLFWINILVSLAITMLIWLAAPLIAAFYGEEELVWLLRVSSLTLVVSGLGAQHSALMNRSMMFGRISVSSGMTAIVSLGVATAWAFAAPSPWALVAASITGAVAGTLVSWYWVRWVPGRPDVRSAGVGRLVSFGAGVTGFKLTNFFSRNLDNVLIGRVWGGEALGYYDRAYKLLLFPIQNVAQPMSRVMVPVLSRLKDEPERYTRAFFRVFGLMQLAILPGVAALTALSETAVPFFLGEQWAASAAIFAALGIAGMSQPLANPTGWLFISQGRTTEMALWGFVSAIITCASFAVGVQYGVVELALVYSVTSMLKLIPLWRLICRKGPIGTDSIYNRILPALGAVLAAFACLMLIRDALPGPALLTLLCGAAVSYAAFSAAFALSAYGREVLAEAARLVLGGVSTLRQRRTRGAS